MTDQSRFHVQVLVNDGTKPSWKRVRPTGGDPYLFNRKDAEQYVRTYSVQSGHWGSYRIEPLPQEPTP